ncbi:AMP-binding protein [Methanosarcinaceae archaeon]|nr:AMP-binding protein [Methanosarcinaceae archaeon]
MLARFLPRESFSSYEDFKTNFRIDIPENFNFGYDIIDEWAKICPEKTALLWCNDHDDEYRISWEELSDLSNRFAAVLKAHGIGKGDAVMYIVKRRWQFWPMAIACMKIGAPFIPASFLLTVKDIDYRCRIADVRLIVGASDKWIVDNINGALKDLSGIQKAVIIPEKNAKKAYIENGTAYASDDPALSDWFDVTAEMREVKEPWICPASGKPASGHDMMLVYFTSGTTGYPKMVYHDYNHPLGHIITAHYWQGLESTDLHISVSDTGWAKCGWGKFYGQWIVGVTNFVYDMDDFVPTNLLKKLQDYKVTTFCAPPTIYRFMIQEDVSGYDLSNIRRSMTAGEALQPEVFNQWKKLTGCSIIEGFGQTEGPVLCANFEWLTPKPGSMGKPSPLYDIDLVDDDGRSVPTGEEGRIVIKGLDKYIPPGLFRCYYKDEASTQASWHDGMYFPGDMAWKDEDGYFWFIGRSDDVIKCSGYRIGPFEVESALQEHPAVLECAVTAVPDPIRGEVVKATIVLTQGYVGSPELIKDIQNHVKKATAPYKYPRVVEFVDSLPKTVSGKIMRKEIRRQDRLKYGG